LFLIVLLAPWVFSLFACFDQVQKLLSLSLEVIAFAVTCQIWLILSVHTESISAINPVLDASNSSYHSFFALLFVIFSLPLTSNFSYPKVDKVLRVPISGSSILIIHSIFFV
jgi:hypothetical protein